MPSEVELEAVFQEAVGCWVEGRFDDSERLLTEAAEGGHVAAAARLGRLYCLDPRRYGDGPGSAEAWLRRAVTARPGDGVSARLLASLLIRWANNMIEEQDGNDEPGLSVWYRWPDRVDDGCWVDEELWADLADAERARRIVDAQDEAERLLTDVLRTNPDDVAAAITLAGLWYGRWDAHRIIAWTGKTCPEAAAVAARMGQALVTQGVPLLHRAADLGGRGVLSGWCRELATAITEGAAGRHPQTPPVSSEADDLTPSGHSWYMVEHVHLVSNNGDVSFTTLLTADRDELRWACTRWSTGWSHISRPEERLTLLIRDGGRVQQIDLKPCLTWTDNERWPLVDWSNVEVPELSGTPLPPGTPASERFGIGPVYYGYS